MKSKGQALLETACMLPILLMLLVGAFQVGLASYDRYFVQYAAVSGAQYCALRNPLGLTTYYVDGLASGMGIQPEQLKVNVSMAPWDMSSCPKEGLRVSACCVRVSMPFKFVIPFVRLKPITLTASAEVPR